MTNPESLETVSTAFNEWRINRASTKGKIPLALRQQAIELLQSETQSRVIKVLKINHATLKRWQQTETPVSDCQFIPVTPNPQPALPPLPMPASLHVILRNAEGGELTICGITLSQVATLATQFTTPSGEPL